MVTKREYIEMAWLNLRHALDADGERFMLLLSMAIDDLCSGQESGPAHIVDCIRRGTEPRARLQAVIEDLAFRYDLERDGLAGWDMNGYSLGGWQDA